MSTLIILTQKEKFPTMKIWEVFANSLPANMTLHRVGAKICDRENPFDPAQC